MEEKNRGSVVAGPWVQLFRRLVMKVINTAARLHVRTYIVGMDKPLRKLSKKRNSL